MSQKDRAAPRATAGSPQGKSTNAPNHISGSNGAGKASEADRAWFEAHPQRSHRLRPAIVNEMPHVDIETVLGGTWTLIRQVQPGFRLRLNFTPPCAPPDDEATAHAIFDLTAERTGGHWTVSEVRARAVMLGSGGRA